jgi:hypothetical protein
VNMVFLSPHRQKQLLTNDSDATVTSACGHGRARGPDPCQRVVALHAAEARGPVIAATRVQQPIEAAGAQTAALGAHRGDGSPLVQHWAVALGGGQVGGAIIPAYQDVNVKLRGSLAVPPTDRATRAGPGSTTFFLPFKH